MALFGSKKNTKEVKAEKKAVVQAVSKSAGSSARDISHVLVRPRVTEKASMLAERNVYAFEVAKSANKRSVAEAVRELYNVTPVEIKIMAIPHRKVVIRGKEGVKRGGKKAYVYLKEGDKIEFV